MKVLFLHPGCLMYAEIYLRPGAAGLGLVAAAARNAGHDVRLVDLQVQPPQDYFRELTDWRPAAVGFSLNYLANVPEVLDLAIRTRQMLPETFLFAGGHSATFVADEILAHAGGALDCVVCGEGEGIVPQLLEAGGDHRSTVALAAGHRDPHGRGPSTTADALDRQSGRDSARPRPVAAAKAIFFGAV